MIEKRGNHHDPGHGKRLETLICTNRVEFERIIGKNYEATKRNCHRKHFDNRHASDLKHAQLAAHEESNKSDDEIETRQCHIWKAVVDIDVFVYLDYCDRRD